MLDEKDKKLLNMAQKGLPVATDPFGRMGEQIGLSADQVVERFKRLKRQGCIRRIGVIFDSAKLGFKTTLIAAAVPEKDFYDVADLVRACAGVTHCYRRDDDEMNLWFTLTVRDESEKRALLDAIKASAPSVQMFDLPARRIFKLKVFFDMADSND